MSLYLEKSLGIDLREESVSLCLLGKKLRIVDVLGGQMARIKPLKQGDEKSEALFLDLANRFLMEHDTWPENVVVSLPRHHLTLQSFELPAPDRKSVDSMVEFELERHFTTGLEGLYYTYHIRPREDNQFHIITAAVKKDIADYYLGLILRLNLKPTLLDASTFANANLILMDNENDASVVALVDLEPHSVDITLMKNKTIEFTRSTPIKDPDMRQAFFQDGRPPEFFEKFSVGLSRHIVDELQNALSSCRTLLSDESIEQIHLMGAGPFASALARQLEKDTEVLTTRVMLPPGVNPGVPENFSMENQGTALALGCRELKNSEIETNLLPEDMQPRRKSKVNLKTTVVLATITLLLAVGWFCNRMIYHDQTLASLNRQLEEIKAEAGTLQKIDLEYESLERQVNEFNAVNRAFPSKLPLLIELSKILPRDTWISQIKFHQDTVELQGYSSAASRLIPIVENSALFKDTGFTGTIIADQGVEKFTLKSRVEAGS